MKHKPYGTIYTPDELPWNELAFTPTVYKAGKTRRGYLNIPCAFDIETSTIETKKADGKTDAYGFMYQWQFCIGEYVVFGRRWEEWQDFVKQLINRLQLSIRRTLVIYVHNLSFEFQYMKEFFHWTDVFCKEARKPMKATCEQFIEFRCSYYLSNMSLAKWCENTQGVTHYKKVDTYDYKKLRTPETPLTEEEQEYCYNDVKGLCECLTHHLKEDTLATIPLTSTGYLRRSYRKRMGENPRNRERFEASELTPELYQLMKEAFRGGDTHANLAFSNQILFDVESYDKKSSYPASMMMDKYPVYAFSKETEGTLYTINQTEKEYAWIARLHLLRPRYIGKTGSPYIPVSKCVQLTEDFINDNGRVLFADGLTITITDLDWDIISKEYVYEDYAMTDVYISRYGDLCDEFKEELMISFRKKTELDGIADRAYEYMKEKNKVNSAYGMMVTDIAQDEITYNGKEYVKKKAELGEALRRYYKSRNSFLSYQHGVWVTANARFRLYEGRELVGRDNVYNDTDSLKFIGDYGAAFAAYNANIIKQAESLGAYADGPTGRKYLGIWEHDAHYEEFKTLGAKKYIVKEDGVYKTTIAGVSKKKGAEYFRKHGIDAFRIGTRIPDSGHLVGYYHDEDIHTIHINNVDITTASSLALVEGGYQIGVTDEYLDLLENALNIPTIK